MHRGKSITGGVYRTSGKESMNFGKKSSKYYLTFIIISINQSPKEKLTLRLGICFLFVDFCWLFLVCKIKVAIYTNIKLLYYKVLS